MIKKLTIDILRACNGEVVRLPGSHEQHELTSKLTDEGYVYFTYDDDQPTHYLTQKGEAFLEEYKRTNS